MTDNKRSLLPRDSAFYCSLQFWRNGCQISDMKTRNYLGKSYGIKNSFDMTLKLVWYFILLEYQLFFKEFYITLQFQQFPAQIKVNFLTESALFSFKSSISSKQKFCLRIMRINYYYYNQDRFTCFKTCVF